MAATAAAGSNSSSANGRRRHSVDVTSTTSSVIQQHLQNVGSVLHPSTSTSSISSIKASKQHQQQQQQHNNEQHLVANPNAHCRHVLVGVGRPLLDVDVIEEGHCKVQGHQGLLRRTYHHGVGFVARLSSSALSPVKSPPSSQLPVTMVTGPANTGLHHLTVVTDTSAERRRSDCYLPMTNTTSLITSTYNSASNVGRRSSSPRPGRRNGVVNPASPDDILRTTSYEEELEVRLEHVRLRAVDTDRRLAAERLRRRQVVQRIAELEEQHVQVVTRLRAEAERKTERLRARCDQVREDCRRRMADAEKRAMVHAEQLESRIREVKSELAEALLQNQRYRKYRLVDPELQQDAATQVDIDIEKNKDTPSDPDVLENRPSSQQPLNVVGQLSTEPVEDGSRVNDNLLRTLTDVNNKSPIADNVWYDLYETITTLAVSRVRYLEELVAGESRRRRHPVTQAHLRRLQAQRRRIINCDSGRGTAGSQPQHRPRETKMSSTALSISVKHQDGRPSSDKDHLQITPSRMLLRRTSSCPAPDMFERTMDDICVDGVSKEDRRAEDAMRSQSADTLCEGNSLQRGTSLSSTPGGQIMNYCSSSSMMTMSEMCDSAFASIRMSPSTDELETDEDFRSSKETNMAEDIPVAMSSKVGPRVIVVDITEAPTISRSSTSKSAKRHSSLHLDLFRKLQTGVANRRRDRTPLTISGLTSAVGLDDDKADVSKRKSSSRNAIKLSNSDVTPPTSPPVRTTSMTGMTGTTGGPLRAVHSPVGGPSTTAVTDGSRSPPPFDVSSGESRLHTLLRRSLPLSPRRISRDSSTTSFTFGCYSDSTHATVSELPTVTPSELSVHEYPVSTTTSTSTSTSTSSTSNGRPKSSSFGRLHERRNGLTAAASVQFKAASASASASGTGQQLGHRTTSQSRLDNLAKNIKTYLTNQ